MISYKGYGTGFPFRLFTKGSNGLEFEEWDGVNRGTYPATESYYPNSSSGALVYGHGTYRPIRLTASQLAELFWRCRYATVDVDLVVYDESFGANPFVGSCAVNRSSTGYIADEIDREIGLIKYPNARCVGENYPTAVLRVQFGDTPETGVWKIGEFYYPFIQLTAGYCYSFIADGNQSSGDYFKGQSGVDFDFFGYADVPLWITVPPGPFVPFTHAVGTASSNFTEYWPYNGRWNTSTGAPT